LSLDAARKHGVKPRNARRASAVRFAGRVPGHEIEYPMAVVTLGGLIGSTLLNRGIVPSINRCFGARNREEEIASIS
jgi:hypothetical protein